jgi:peptidoglycan L-alanyl-D-glutamate endopeptidase CwlK
MLDSKSKIKLKTLRPELVEVYNRAADMVPFVLRMTCSSRTKEEQKILVATGKSRTMKSFHIPGPGGLSRAMDLVAIVNGEPDWTLNRYYEIADAIRGAAAVCERAVVWGAIWDKELRNIVGSLRAAHASYHDQFERANGRPPFLDAPHFQLGLS